MLYFRRFCGDAGHGNKYDWKLSSNINYIPDKVYPVRHIQKKAVFALLGILLIWNNSRKIQKSPNWELDKNGKSGRHEELLVFILSSLSLFS